MHRKSCAFDGLFEKFVFIESDTLVFQPFNHVFSKLEKYDFVVHDFQRLTSIRRNTVKNYFDLFKEVYGSEDNLTKRFHCSGFWASKQGFFNEKDLDKILQELENGEIQVFRNTWLGEQSILNHISLKKNLHLYNFTLDENSEYSTSVCVTSKHVESKNHILYDGGKKLTYLHYMGVKNERLQQLCRWKKRNLPINNIFLALGDKLLKSQMKNIPYKEVFLYYRFITEA